MHSTCHDTTTKAARRYVSPRSRPLTREEAEIRALAYAIKDITCDDDLVDAAAAAMYELVKGENAFLVPAPNHYGETLTMKRLACAIAKLAPNNLLKVADVLARRYLTDSQCIRHRERLPPLTPAEHYIYLRPLGPGRDTILLDGKFRIYFVDNVITSGTTIQACRNALLGFGTGLVYADAHNDKPN